jgi:hypothetical protein
MFIFINLTITIQPNFQVAKLQKKIETAMKIRKNENGSKNKPDIIREKYVLKICFGNRSAKYYSGVFKHHFAPVLQIFAGLPYININVNPTFIKIFSPENCNSLNPYYQHIIFK